MVKSQLGAALDAAALAAGASSGTTAQQQAVAAAYLAANFPGGNGVVLGTPTYSLSGSPITVTATAKVPTTFMQVVGINSLTVGATTQVMRTLEGLEVALVLDNTGSMMYPNTGASSSNMAALKQAAGSLVTTLYGATTTNNPFLRVALVPYVAAVNPGSIAPSMVSGSPTLDTSDAKGWLGCVTERSSTFQNFSSSPSYTAVAADLDKPANATNGYLGQYSWPAELVQSNSKKSYYNECVNAGGSLVSQGVCNVYTTGTTSTYTTLANYAWGSNSIYGPNRSCPTPVVPLTNNLAPLISAIGVTSSNVAITTGGWGPTSSGGSGMSAWNNGGTMGSIGMAWGYRVLSPNGPYTKVSTVNPWTTPQWKKVVVLMTDGVNDFFDDQYTGFGPYQSAFTTTLVDKQEEAVCDALKAQGVTIYTVFFNSNSTPGPAISYCAGTQVGVGNAAYYFNAQNQTDLANAFNTIGDILTNLRISQ